MRGVMALGVQGVFFCFYGDEVGMVGDDVGELSSMGIFVSSILWMQQDFDIISAWKDSETKNPLLGSAAETRDSDLMWKVL
jgi:hypothetical protein